MFCGKCGKEIVSGIKFCPGCGRETEVKNSTGSFNSDIRSSNAETPDRKFSYMKKSMSVKKDIPQNVWLIGGFILLAVVMIGIMLAFGGKKEENYSVEGIWKVEGFLDLGEILSEAVAEKTGLNAGDVAGILDMIGLDIIEDVTLTFASSGQIFVGAEDIGGSVGDLKYSNAGEGKMILSYSLSIPIIGQSVTATYTSEYEVGKDNMTLDFFGTNLKLIRMSDK